MASKIELSKENKIIKEERRLTKLFKGIGEERRKLVTELIKNAAFMVVSLEELRDIVNVKGYSETYKNGENQIGVKKCTEYEAYLSTMKLYVPIIKQLAEMLPDKSSEQDELETFIKRGAI